MDLEQRVTMLEQEVQILKNQIQATLLDIQEHLLTNTYPSLRAEDDAAPIDPVPVKTISANPDTPAALSAPDMPDPDFHTRPTPAPVPGSAPYSTQTPEVSTRRTPAPFVAPPPAPARRALAPLTVEPAYGTSAPPYSGNGAYTDAKVPPFVIDEDYEDFPGGATTDTPITSADWALMEQLVEWTNRRLAAIGARNTRQLIHRYTAEGRISPDVRDALLQIVAIGTVPSDPDREPITITPAPSLIARPAEGNGRGKDGNVSSNVILRLIAGIARGGKKHG
jgi:hypothetical protein